MVSTFYAPRRFEADEVNPWSNLLSKALGSYNALTETQYKEPTLKEALMKAQLANKYYGPNMESQIGLRNAEAGAIPSQTALREAQTGAIPSQIAMHMAQTRRSNQLADMPFGGQLAGPAKEAFALELLKGKYGEDSNVYKDAVQSYNANVHAKEGLTNYRGALTDTAQKRASSPLAKTAQELEEINAGFMPGTNGQVKLDPEQQQSLSGQYQLKMQKDVSDAQTRQKVNLATNIDKTLDSITPEILVKPSGIRGATWLKQEQLKAANNNESEEYKVYRENVAKSNLLAKQVRQFYGESIQPTMTAKIEKMTNPTNWLSNPRVAVREFNAFKDILKKETQTYKDALKRPQTSSEENVIEYVKDASGRYVPSR